jgi:hypothetical protein
MKKFNFIFIALAIVFLTSCEASEMSDAVVVEQVNNNDIPDDCEDCYKYEVKLKTYKGETYYLTNYKHSVGDTLFSKTEFRDLRVKAIEVRDRKIDSLIQANSKLSKKNEELEMYNQLLIGIVKNNTTKVEQP